ncbi:MAG: hypothetical protein U0441_23430 [Polyangiaceae bacterium]
MDELVMTILASERETRVLLMHGPDEVMKARLRVATMPAHRFAGPMLCESMALWHDLSESALSFLRSRSRSCSRWFCATALGVARTTLHYVVVALVFRRAAAPRSMPVGSG